MSAADEVRARAKKQMRTVILDTARSQLAERGATDLSVRAVARDVGMASSAVYRYFENRDALLTALIIDAYDALGETAERAEDQVAPDDLLGRWLALTHGCRDWALTHPHEYALVYGSPVPGYKAPVDIVGPASRVFARMARLLGDVVAAGLEPVELPVRPAVDAALGPLRRALAPGVSVDLATRGLGAAVLTFGTISFELFGQLQGVVEVDGRGHFFDEQMRRAALSIGVTARQD